MGRLKKEQVKVETRGRKPSVKNGKEMSLRALVKSLKGLSFADLEILIGEAMRLRKEKMGSEELRLIREKEEIELRIKKIKQMDNAVNG